MTNQIRYLINLDAHSSYHNNSNINYDYNVNDDFCSLKFFKKNFSFHIRKKKEERKFYCLAKKCIESSYKQGRMGNKRGWKSGKIVNESFNCLGLIAKRSTFWRG